MSAYSSQANFLAIVVSSVQVHRGVERMYGEVLAAEMKGDVDLDIARQRPYVAEVLILHKLRTGNVAVNSIGDGSTADVECMIVYVDSRQLTKGLAGGRIQSQRLP